MTDTGPTTTTLEVDQPIQREKDEILRARQEVTVSRDGTLSPMNLAQALEVAQAMAKASFAVPAHLRGSPGACLAVLEYANGWGFMAYAVANKSYVVNDRLAFESQLIHSVIEMHAPLHRDSLNFEFVDEGDKRRCKVWAQCLIRGAVKVLTWEGTEIGKIQPKNSPLWKTKPDLQLFYNSSRDWARVFFPHILMGAYTKEELEDMPENVRADMAKDVTPPKGTGLAARLTGGNGGEGFHPDNVRDLGGTTGAADELANIAADVQPVTQATTVKDAGMTHPAQTTESTGVTVSEPVQEGKSAPAPTATPIDPTPAAKPVEDKKPEPKDHDEYVAHLEAWLARAKDDAWVHDNYKDEKALRTRCGADITICNKMKNARLKELGAA